MFLIPHEYYRHAGPSGYSGYNRLRKVVKLTRNLKKSPLVHDIPVAGPFGNRTHRVRLLSLNQKILTAETSASRFRILCLPKLSSTYLFNHFVPALLAQIPHLNGNDGAIVGGHDFYPPPNCVFVFRDFHHV